MKHIDLRRIAIGTAVGLFSTTALLFLFHQILQFPDAELTSQLLAIVILPLVGAALTWFSSEASARSSHSRQLERDTQRMELEQRFRKSQQLEDSAKKAIRILFEADTALTKVVGMTATGTYKRTDLLAFASVMGRLNAVINSDFPLLGTLVADYYHAGCGSVTESTEYSIQNDPPEGWKPDMEVRCYCVDAITEYLRERFINGDKSIKPGDPHPRGVTRRYWSSASLEATLSGGTETTDGTSPVGGAGNESKESG